MRENVVFKLPAKSEFTVVLVLNIVFLVVTGIFIGLRVASVFAWCD